MAIEIDPIVTQAIAALAKRDEISLSLATITLVNYAVTYMTGIAGEEDTRGWCNAAIDDAVRNQEAA